MALITLPNELLFTIVQATMPDGYEAFVLSCKRIYEVGVNLLQRHNRLRRRFATFRYLQYGGLPSSLSLLHNIANDALIGDYIRTADLRYSLDPQDFESVQNWHALLEDRRAAKSVIRILDELDLPNYLDFPPQKSLKSIQKSDLSLFVTILVLSLLPNLEELILPSEWPKFPPSLSSTCCDEKALLWEALDTIAFKANIHDRRKRPLSKLTRLHLAYLNYAEPISLQQTLSWCLILPSLRELYASNCLATRESLTGRPFNWRYPTYTSSLQKVEFASCCFDGLELANLLKYTPQLRSFKLSYASKSYGRGTHWSADAVIEALRQSCAGTLMELSLTIDDLAGCIKGGLCSLKEFGKLYDLELDVRCFFGPSVATDELRDMSPADYREYAYSVARWTGALVPSLDEILPFTIRKVRFIAGACREDILVLKSLFARANALAVGCLPRLETLAVFRAKSKIGVQYIASGQSESAWKSISNTVRTAGYQFEEHEDVCACWLDHHWRRADLLVRSDYHLAW